MGSPRPKVPTRKYPTAHIAGTMGKSAPVDTSGVDRDMKITMGAEPDSAAVKPKKTGIDWWKLLGIKH